MTNGAVGTCDRGRIWILEDSALEAELARRALSSSQDVELFTDGSVILERASSSPLPDVIVLDGQLPGISGVEVCRVLRAANDAMSLPILMLTSRGEKEFILEALDAGANDYVTKPYDVSEVTARVSALVRMSRLHVAQVRRSWQLSLSAEVGAALTTGKDLSEIADRCIEAIAKHLDAPIVEVWTKRSNDELLLLAARARKTPAAVAGAPESLVQSVAAQQEALVTDEPSSVRELAQLQLMGFAALPLVVRGETLGVLVLGTAKPLGDAEPMLTTIADLLALGVARARVEAERTALLERERNARGEAEAANRSKDDFLAMVSHELRTPLSAITGWASMLLAGGLDAQKTKRALEVIERSARSQAKLIDDLLDISRIVSGSLRVNVGTVDVPSVAEMALESVRLAAEGKGIALEANIDVTAGQLSGDADRIQQIIWNLLTNAIKFTPTGGRVALELSREPRGIAIDVVDSGQGLAPEFLPHIFERFKQADATTTRAKGGLGLGLAIVKHLVELHGGTIEAHSDGLGKGSRFHVVLPTLAAAKEMSQFPTSGAFSAARPSLDRPRELEGLRILVVDDEDDARELIRMLLESCKACVTDVSGAAEAYEALQTNEFDVVLSDIAMPEEDGLSFIKRVRALPRERGGRIPAIALSAYARLEDRTRVLRAGFDNHVAKPVEASELLAVLACFANR